MTKRNRLNNYESSFNINQPNKDITKYFLSQYETCFDLIKFSHQYLIASLPYLRKIANNIWLLLNIVSKSFNTNTFFFKFENDK